MNCAPKSRHHPWLCRAADRRGFTLAEVLAALVFLAIVIPVAVEGLRAASRAGTASQRKAAATRIAEQVLNDWLLSGSRVTGLPRGVVEENGQQYEWTLRSEPWTEDALRLVTVEVLYLVQGDEFDLRLSTLAGLN